SFLSIDPTVLNSRRRQWFCSSGNCVVVTSFDSFGHDKARPPKDRPISRWWSAGDVAGVVHQRLAGERELQREPRSVCQAEELPGLAGDRDTCCVQGRGGDLHQTGSRLRDEHGLYDVWRARNELVEVDVRR